MAPHPIPFPCALAFPLPSHRDATTPSPCWAPHFMTQERVMFSNPTPSKPRLSPAVTMSDDMLSALTPPFHCGSILQPANPLQVVAFESWTISAPICLNRFTFAESRRPDFWTSVCVFAFFSSAFAFLIELNALQSHMLDLRLFGFVFTSFAFLFRKQKYVKEKSS